MTEEKVNQAEKEEELQAEELPKDGTETIFENGPTVNQVENWKQEHDGNVYMTEYPNQTYIWRPLARPEFKKIVNLESESNNEWFREERVVEACVLYPVDFSHDDVVNGLAGTPSSLTDEIMNKSGFMPENMSVKL